MKTCLLLLLLPLGVLGTAVAAGEDLETPDFEPFSGKCDPNQSFYDLVMRELEDTGRDLSAYEVKGPYCVGGGRKEVGRRLNRFVVGRVKPILS